MNRRHILASLASLAGLAIAPSRANSSRSAAPTPSPSPAPVAKNFILLVADGLGNGALSLYSHFLRDVAGSPSRFEILAHSPATPFRHALQNTRSASSLVTDSAAASSAWGCGHRVPNGHLNTSASGATFPTLAQKAKASGRSIGMVSTCSITHATPAGFSINSPLRENEEAIAKLYLDLNPDCLLGGGSRFFPAELLQSFRAAGFRLPTNASQLSSTSPGKTLGLFAPSHLPYAIDRQANAAIPSLPQLATHALNSLAANPNGFFLQIEAGRIDHAAHANDPLALIHDAIEFDQTLPVISEFILNHPDTLVVITADHGTGGIQLNGAGPNYNATPSLLARARDGRCSLESLFLSLPELDTLTPQTLANHIHARIGIAPTLAEAAPLLDQLRATPAQRDPSVLALSRWLSPNLGIGWTTPNHTADLVSLLATGPGSLLVPNWIDNFQLHDIVCKASGLPLSSPA